jgi:hypothetical protein
MTISKSLEQFYKENNFKDDGGENDDFFELKLKFFNLKLPNSQFRKDVIHIHDIQHVLYNCDTTWKGEAFIAGWEISTGFWKHLPVGFFSLWAMGFSLLIHPKEVLKGFKEGINTIGIVDLNMQKEALLILSISELKTMIKKDKAKQLNWFQFLFWSLTSVFIVLFPVLILISVILYFL